MNSIKKTGETKTTKEKCDKTKGKIPKDEIDTIWEISIMVDAHIIATEFNIDSLTAVMCIHPPCKNNEQIYFTKL